MSTDGPDRREPARPHPPVRSIDDAAQALHDVATMIRDRLDPDALERLRQVDEWLHSVQGLLDVDAAQRAAEDPAHLGEHPPLDAPPAVGMIG